MVESRRIAIHEAGHTVMAYLQGKKSDGVSIIPNGTRRGLSKHIPNLPEGFGPNHDGYVRELEKLALISLSGYAAERHAYGEGDFYGAQVDQGVVGHSVYQMLGTTIGMEPKVAELLSKAESLLKEHWPLVTYLTACLMEWQELSGEQVEKYIQKYYDNTSSGPKTESDTTFYDRTLF